MIVVNYPGIIRAFSEDTPLDTHTKLTEDSGTWSIRPAQNR